MAKDYSNIEGLIGNVKESIRNAYDKGYKQGFNEGQAHQLASDDVFRESCEKSAYEKGLNDAWECARKIVQREANGEENIVDERLDSYDTFMTYTAAKCITRIKEYEEKQKTDSEVKVGDEVIDGNAFNHGKGIVTFVSPIVTYVLWYDGSTGRRKLEDIKKTGRHFDKIAEVLEQLKEVQNETK